MVKSPSRTESHTQAAVLLHEHDLRIGNYASAFTITGLAVRMAQGLQINLETLPDAACSRPQPDSPSIHESRRRLMWAVYIMDSWVGSGIDELSLVHEADIKVQLPCDERDFVFGIPKMTGYLEPFPGPVSPGPPQQTEQDLAAQFVRLISLRRRVLR